ncbi:hypothetical protein G6F22_018636 [Rhizopus arrhizus]|nr:hypothetical protein G6F22_018636 [Rhizopus arrhizus]
MGEQPLGAGQVGHVGVLLAGEHRVARVAFDLRALDLGIPVGTLDQAHLQATTGAARHVGQVVDRVRRALLVGLHDHAEAIPAGQRGIAEHLSWPAAPVPARPAPGPSARARAWRVRSAGTAPTA